MNNDRCVFFGTGSFSEASLAALIANGLSPIAVVTKPDQPAGRGQKLTAPAIKSLAQMHGIPVFQPSSPSEILGELAKLEPGAAVVVAYGKMIPLEMLQLFPKGIINIHPSLLPRYRGASPIEGAILAGDSETGVSLMRINEKMDQGPVYVQEQLKLNGHEIKTDLSAMLSKIGARLLVDNLPGILSGQIVAKPQDDAAATYVKLIQKSDGEIDWSKPAQQIEREVRAYIGWPGSRTVLGGKEVTVTAAHISKSEVQNPKSELALRCGDGQFLVIDKLKPAGRNEMTGKEFLAGNPIA